MHLKSIVVDIKLLTQTINLISDRTQWYYVLPRNLIHLWRCSCGTLSSIKDLSVVVEVYDRGGKIRIGYFRVLSPLCATSKPILLEAFKSFFVTSSDDVNSSDVSLLHHDFTYIGRNPVSSSACPAKVQRCNTDTTYSLCWFALDRCHLLEAKT